MRCRTGCWCIGQKNGRVPTPRVAKRRIAAARNGGREPDLRHAQELRHVAGIGERAVQGEAVKIVDGQTSVVKRGTFSRAATLEASRALNRLPRRCRAVSALSATRRRTPGGSSIWP